ncbi:MAG: DUF4339 domain-containing protein [Planctomycetaceae bacterium]
MSKEWFYQLMGSEFGPLNSAELRHKVTRGEIFPDTPVRMGNSARWVDASQIKGLFDIPAAPALTAASPTVKPTVPAPPADASIKSTGAVEQSSSQKIEPPATPQDDLLDAHAANEDFEFFNFVGFRQALSAPLYDVVDAFRQKKAWTMTQITRRALAEFVGRPELAEDQPPVTTEQTPTETATSISAAANVER